MSRRKHHPQRSHRDEFEDKKSNNDCVVCFPFPFLNHFRTILRKGDSSLKVDASSIAKSCGNIVPSKIQIGSSDVKRMVKVEIESSESGIKSFEKTGKSCQTDDSSCPHTKYLSGREMTPLQERINAITNLPQVFYCFLFLFSGSWLTPSMIEKVRNDMPDETFQHEGCINISWLPNFHALPPTPILAVALGICLHCPFAFIYHFVYAPYLVSRARIDHWSRRMDQIMIHAFSSLSAYAVNGSIHLIAGITFFNMECIYLQLLQQVIPRRNQLRLVISLLAFAIPILQRGDFLDFVKIHGFMFLGFCIFATYPFGGWSHAIFHLINMLVPPIMMKYVLELSPSQDQLNFAAKCAILRDSV